jgi:hypothetical protein
LGAGILLVYLSLALVIGLLETPQFQHLLILSGILLGALWWCYSKLPDWLQELIRTLWRWKNHDN